MVWKNKDFQIGLEMFQNGLEKTSFKSVWTNWVVFQNGLQFGYKKFKSVCNLDLVQIGLHKFKSVCNICIKIQIGLEFALLFPIILAKVFY